MGDEDPDANGKRKACSRSQSKNGLSGPIQLDAPGGKVGITPQHRTMHKSCIGLYFGKMVADPHVERVTVAVGSVTTAIPIQIGFAFAAGVGFV
jgi:hypothetical protein